MRPPAEVLICDECHKPSPFLVTICISMEKAKAVCEGCKDALINTFQPKPVQVELDPADIRNA